MNTNDERISFVTAAYGAAWYPIVRGLARTFSQFHDSPLIIYTDSKDMNLPGCIIDNSLTLDRLKMYAGNLPLRSAKPLILLDAANKYGNICWIDADMLVFTNLSSKMNPNKINVISYGYGKRLRNCGANLQIPQKNYLMSGFFFAPQKYILEFEKLWNELKQDIAASVKTYDQSVLNHLAVRNSSEVDYLNKLYPNFAWNFERFRYRNRLWAGHPKLRNKLFCSGLRLTENTLYFNQTPIAVLYWTSLSLKRHIKTSFRSIKNDTAREYLIHLYQ